MSASTPVKPSFSIPRKPLTPNTNKPSSEPLTPNTNKAPSEPSTPYASARSKQSDFLLRHKLSIQTFRSYLDSSESIPSAHESIYEASVVSRNSENVPFPDHEEPKDVSHENAVQSIRLRDMDPLAERQAIDQFAWSNRVEAVHSPHRLEPITEKNSFATLQTKASSILRGHRPTASQASKATLKPPVEEPHPEPHPHQLRHVASASPLSLPLPTIRPRHRKSLSLPSFSRRSKHTSSSSITIKPLNFPTIPKRPPPSRKPTPPGLPKFNTQEAINYRLPAPPAKFRDHFRSRRLVDQEYRRQTTSLPRGVVMRGENGELIRGRWRAGPSGHGVGGQQPWSYAMRGEDTAEMMRYPGDGSARIRVERPVSGVPSVSNVSGAGVNGPEAAVMHGANNETPGGTEQGPPGKEKWYHKLAWFCCGWTTQVDEDGGEWRARKIWRARAPEPLFVGATNVNVPVL